jgi:hypothetical protein
MTAICALPPLSSSTRTDMLGLQAADCLASGSLQCETELHGAEHTDIGESNLPVAEPQMRSPAHLRRPWRAVTPRRTKADCAYSSSRLLIKINAPATSKEGEKAHEARPPGQ